MRKSTSESGARSWRRVDGVLRRDNLIYAQVGAEAAPPYSTFTVLLLLSGNEVGAALSARPLLAAAAAGMTRARPQRAAKSMVPRARRIDGFAVRCTLLLQGALWLGTDCVSTRCELRRALVFVIYGAQSWEKEVND